MRNDLRKRLFICLWNFEEYSPESYMWRHMSNFVKGSALKSLGGSVEFSVEFSVSNSVKIPITTHLSNNDIV